MSLASRLRTAPGASSRLAASSLLAASLAGLACSSPAPLPGGPPPVFEPGRALSLPGEDAPAPSAPPPAPDTPAPAPDVPPPPPAGSPTPGAAPSGAAPPSPAPSGGGPSSWTSTGVEAAPVAAGAGDPVPADGRLGAKHLVVMYAGSRQAPPAVTRTRDEARKRAEECLAKARAPGASFEKVVAECTDEPHGAKRGGDLFTFPAHAMVPEFTKGVLDTRVGHLSGVVESPFGFHVILRTK